MLSIDFEKNIAALHRIIYGEEEADAPLANAG